MIDLDVLIKRFPKYKIVSQPAIGCGCNDGVRKTKLGYEFPCLCVCIKADPKIRADFTKIVGQAAQKISV
jgi:hypothetical protein